MSASIYPPVGFYFYVTIDGATLPFQEVSGLDHEIDVENVKGGGENAYEIRLPGRYKYNNLVLKRGFVDDGNSVWAKFSERFPVEKGLDNPISTLEVDIELLDENQAVIAKWTATNAYPVKWNVSPFNAMESKIVIETVEFAHHGIKVASI